MFTNEILMMLFDELGLDFEEWAAIVGLAPSWTDKQIYDALPDAVKALCGEFGLNASWMHGGM